MSESPLGIGAGLLAFLLSTLACSTDTSGLARRPSEAGQGGVADGSAPSAGGSGGVAGAATGEGGAGLGVTDPAGGALAIVHGLVDGGRLFACLRDVASGEALASDAPEPAGGVPYGGSLSVPTTWDVAARDVEIELFVAVPESAATQSCSALRARAGDSDPLPPRPPDGGAPDAGPPSFPLEPSEPRRAGSVRLSPGVVRAGVHYALVAAGCTRPEGSPSEDVCGPEDPVFGTRQALVLAELAGGLGAEEGGFGLQFLNASRAVSRADLVLQWESQRQSQRIAGEVAFGAVRPREAAAADEPVGVELHVQGANQSSYTQAWSDTVAASSDGALAEGSNYLIAYVGPLPGVSVAGVASPRFVLIRGRAAPEAAATAQ